LVRRGGEGLTALDDTIDGSVRQPDDAPGPAPEGDEGGPLRRCIATGAVLPKESLIRFVVAPDGVVTVDLAEKLPGRGLWVSADAAAFAKAIKANLFARAARRPVVIPDGFAAHVVALLRQACINLVAMARRAGQAVAGYEKVRARLLAGHGVVLLVACDGAADGRGKVAGLAAAVPKLAIVDVLDADALGAAFGRDRVVHVLLERGGLARRLVVEAGRLSGLAGTSVRAA
jgi:predicted RNA-binding protein YlxR (DUF448 family)